MFLALDFDPRDWLMSEKLDGWFARWDGERFATASGNAINAPDWFTAGLPKRELRGELCAGCGNFDSIARIVRSGAGWERLRFAVHPPARIASTAHVVTIPETVCGGHEHLESFFRSILASGGEGVMLRRGSTVHKVKPEADEEAVVIGMATPGSLLVSSTTRGEFKVSGLTRNHRANPPGIGSLVTFRFSGLTANGIPKSAMLKGIRPLETIAA